MRFLVPAILFVVASCELPAGAGVGNHLSSDDGGTRNAGEGEGDDVPGEGEGQGDGGGEGEGEADGGGEGEGEGDAVLPDEDAARVVSLSFPAELACGASAVASVRMENTGSLSWTAASYRLGAVDDGDALAGPTRVYLDEDDEIVPGALHTFTFAVRAPSTPGVFRSDWRMVHELVRWFGDVAQADVVVDCAGSGEGEGEGDGEPPDAFPEGLLLPSPLDVDVLSPTNVRKIDVAWAAQRFVTVATEVQPSGRHLVRALAVEAGALLGLGPAIVVDDGGDANNTLEPAVAAAADGTLLAVWEDARFGAGEGQREIFAQRLRVDGASLTPLGANLDVTSLPGLQEYSPCVAADVDGGFFVAWSDERELGVRPDGRVLFGRSVHADGSVGEEVRLGDASSSWQMQCDAASGAGVVLVAWNDYVPVAGNVLDIAYRAIVVDSGAPASPILTLKRIGNVVPDAPGIAFDPVRNRFLVVWAEAPNPGRHIRGSLLAPDGSVLRGDFLVADSPVGAAVPHVAFSAAADAYLVTFHAMTTTDAFAVELDGNGERRSARASVNAAPPFLGTFTTPLAAAADAPRFFVVMQQNYARVAGTVFALP